MSTRDLGTGSLLSTFSVGRTGVVEGGGGGVVLRGGEEQGMTRLRLAPRSLWGPLGPPQSPPPHFIRFLLSPFKSILSFFVIYFFTSHSLFSISPFPLVFRIPLSKRHKMWLSACFSTTMEGSLIHF